MIDRSHALRGNASMDALRPLGTRSVPGCIPTRSVGTIIRGLHPKLIHQFHLVRGQRVEMAADLRRFGGLAGQGFGDGADC